MSERLLKGIGVSAGIAVGPVVVVPWTLPEVPRLVVTHLQVDMDVSRMRATVLRVKPSIVMLTLRA